MPDIMPLTLLWKVYPIQQDGYYTTFFHAQTSGAFVGNATYFGCHPYPPGGSSSTTHNWEISIQNNDYTVDANSNDTTVNKNAWYSQAASSRQTVNDTTVDFYWDLRTSVNRRITRETNVGTPLANYTTNPGLTFGDAPWQENVERLSGRLRGIQVYSTRLSEANIQALEAMESDAAVIAKCTALGITSLWYLNMNPAPSDITDKSGNGHDPAWVSADHGTLWEP